MDSQIVDLIKFVVVIAGSATTIWVAAKTLGSAMQRRPEPIREYDSKFQAGEKRMDGIDDRLSNHEVRFEKFREDHTTMLIEMAGLRPLFTTMKESVGALKDQVDRVEGTLTSILTRLPPET